MTADNVRGKLQLVRTFDQNGNPQLTLKALYDQNGNLVRLFDASDPLIPTDVVEIAGKDIVVPMLQQGWHVGKDLEYVVDFLQGAIDVDDREYGKILLGGAEAVATEMARAIGIAEGASEIALRGLGVPAKQVEEIKSDAALSGLHTLSPSALIAGIAGLVLAGLVAAGFMFGGFGTNSTTSSQPSFSKILGTWAATDNQCGVAIPVTLTFFLNGTSLNGSVTSTEYVEGQGSNPCEEFRLLSPTTVGLKDIVSDGDTLACTATWLERPFRIQGHLSGDDLTLSFPNGPSVFHKTH